jgi:hypothetical protein
LVDRALSTPIASEEIPVQVYQVLGNPKMLDAAAVTAKVKELHEAGAAQRTEVCALSVFPSSHMLTVLRMLSRS